MAEFRAAVLLKERVPKIGLTHCYQSIAFTGPIVFPLSDFEPTPLQPLQGNRASLVFTTGEPQSTILILSEAVKRRLNAPDPCICHPPISIDASIKIGVDASVLSFIYAAVLSEDICCGEPPDCDRVEFYIQASNEQIRQASIADKVTSFEIRRWWLWKSDDP